MAKIGDKEAQRRALREAALKSPAKTPPPAIRVAPGAGIFDRTAYQREYMKAWRKRRKAERS